MSRPRPAQVGDKPPRRVPLWLARPFAGEAVVMMGTESRGASKGKAERELGWELRYPSWRQGFVAAYASSSSVSESVKPGRQAEARGRVGGEPVAGGTAAVRGDE